jgi:asparagine synthase (glutamine-hydrolysing)
MCGIFGLVESDGDSNSQLVTLNRARACLQHRGPDDFGFKQWRAAAGNTSIGFGQTRLAIIDLTHGGHQPQTTQDERYSIVFNGEIYNYLELRAELSRLGAPFKSDSDTEVLLQAWALWGEAMLGKLQGMFAFAVYDTLDGTVTCVRDAFGVKPLFFFIDDKRFGFASELSALRLLRGGNTELNSQIAMSYLVDGKYDNGRNTFFSAIETLLPGEILTCRTEPSGPVVRLKKWWRVEDIEPKEVPFEQAVEQVRHEFISSVATHLRSDVPVGVALSGGIDSSAVAAVVRHLEPEMDLATFSFAATASTISEEPWVDLVNSRLGARAHKIKVQPHDLNNDINDLIAAQGEPFGSTSVYAQYRVFRSVKDAGIKVTLEGQGADELLAGYHGYPEARLRSLIEKKQFASALAFIRNWSRWPGRNWKVLVAQGLAAMSPSLSNNSQLRQFALDLFKLELDRAPTFVKAPFTQEALDASVPMNAEFHGRRLSEALGLALGEAGVTSLLRHSDRNSMHFSVESRVPFLTTNLASLVLGLPEHHLVSAKGETKSVFRAAMRGIVPDEILDRKDKIGFETYDREWIRSVIASDRDLLGPIRDLEFIDINAVSDALKSFEEGNPGSSWPTWRIINFSIWYQLTFS